MITLRHDGQAKDGQEDQGLLIGIFYTSYAILTVEIAPSRGALLRALANWCIEQAHRKLPVGDVVNMKQLCQEADHEEVLRFYQERVSSLWDAERLHVQRAGDLGEAFSVD